jgi:hypothetical protein
MVIRPAHMVQAGPVGGNLSTASETYEENHSKAWHTPIIDLCNDM